MVISCDKLWKILVDKKTNRTELNQDASIHFNVPVRMGKQEAVSIENIEKNYYTLGRNIGNIMDIIESDGHKKETKFTSIEFSLEQEDWR